MSSIKKTNKARLRHATLSSSILLIVFAVYIIVTAIVDQTKWQIDMTQNKLATLSSESKQFLKTIDQPVSILFLFKTYQQSSKEFKQADDLLRQYAQASSKIQYQVIDPDVHPELLPAKTSEEQSFDSGTIIVKSQQFSRIIPLNMWSIYSSNPQTGANNQISLNLEGPVSNAIAYVLGAKQLKVYTITGHGEINPEQMAYANDQSFAAFLRNQNYEVQPLSLTNKSFPTDADILCLLSPEDDLSTYEIEQLQNYVQSGGQLWINLIFSQGKQKRLLQWINSIGISVSDPVVERDPSRLIAQFGNNPTYFIPDIQPFDITKGLEGMLLVGQPLQLKESTQKKRYVTLQPLLQSSGKAGLLILDADGNINEPTPLVSPAILAYAITSQLDTNAPTSRIVLTTGDLRLVSVVPGTAKLTNNILTWLNNRSDQLNIPSKVLFQMPLRINVPVYLIYGALFVIIIPSALLIMALVVWNKRRKL
jgi:ABC-2 type transport system permease protein